MQNNKNFTKKNLNRIKLNNKKQKKKNYTTYPTDLRGLN